MELVKAHAVLISEVPENENPLRMLEWIGRLAWKSEDKMTEDSAPRFVKMILDKKHESVIEHLSATVKFVVDRGVSHEIVRHRIASYTQESTRYCNYKRKGVVFIEPPFETPEARELWVKAMGVAEAIYLQMIDIGVKPQIARSVLPNSLKTEIIMTANLREWRHFFKLRTDPSAHPQFREVAIPLLAEFKRVYPVVFDDINPD
jgi:thymidylate synthase (FAD)